MYGGVETSLKFSKKEYMRHYWKKETMSKYETMTD